ncbi:LysR family transcriptional regulator [Roseibium sp. M-1]
MQLDPRHLVHLAAIIDEGSFSVAAERLGMTQPALSKMVADLEARLGTPLLAQRRRPVLPTPLGQTLAAQGHAIRAAIDSAEFAITGDRQGSQGLLKIGAPPFFCERVLPDLIIAFWERSPYIRFELTTAYQTELLELIEGRSIDFALAPIGMEQAGRSFKNETLLLAEHVVVARKSHAILNQSNVGAEALSQLVWVSQMPNSMLYEIATESLQRLGVTKLNTLLKSDSASTLMKMLRSVDCVTVLPTFAILEGVQNGWLGVVQTEALPQVAFGAVYHDAIPLAPVAKNFIQYVKTQLLHLNQTVYPSTP